MYRQPLLIVQLVMKQRRILYAIMALAAVGAIVFYYIHDPEAAGWMPKCLFKRLTGLSCPGCGFQRALHASLHGHLLQAWRYNMFYVISLPYLCVLVWGQLPRLPYSAVMRRLSHDARISRAFVILLFAWWIGRNIWGV